MQDVREEISEEKYRKYKGMSHGEVSEVIQSALPETWRWGYGWYGFELIEDGGKYYIVHTIGSTCD